MAKQKQKSQKTREAREAREAEMKDWKEKLTQVVYVAAAINERSSDFLTALHELKTCTGFRRLLDVDPEQMSARFENSVYSTFPSIRSLMHEFSGVVNTAINLGITPTLENFASLSSLSSVPYDHQAWVLNEVTREYPDSDIERANMIIRSVNHSMGVGNKLKEYSSPAEMTQNLSEILGRCRKNNL